MKSITPSLKLKNGSYIEFGEFGEFGDLRGSALDYLLVWAEGNKNGTSPDVEHFQVLPTERPILKDLYKDKMKKAKKRKKK